MIQYRPTFRCIQCKKRKIREGIIAWLFQPPMPINGRGDSPGNIYFRCNQCRTHS